MVQGLPLDTEVKIEKVSNLFTHGGDFHLLSGDGITQFPGPSTSKLSFPIGCCNEYPSLWSQ